MEHVVHLIEPGGNGGVFQHTIALASLLCEQNYQVCVHTATDHEPIDVHPDLTICRCMKWYRQGTWRKGAIASRYLTLTLPHLLKATRRNQIAHIQGNWNPILAPLLAALLRGMRRPVVLTPHNTFARTGRKDSELLLSGYFRLANSLIVFSRWDQSVLASRGLVSIVSPLIMVGSLNKLSGEWRKRWNPGTRRVLLFAGQLREDKRLDRVIRALQLMEDPPLLAVVGEDKGRLKPWQDLSEDCGVDARWSVGFQPLDSFVGAIREADFVICPYEQASQSGVLSMAQQYGVPTVASRAGGLAELADYATEMDSPEQLASYLKKILERDEISSEATSLDERTLTAHLEAYERARHQE